MVKTSVSGKCCWLVSTLILGLCFLAGDPAAGGQYLDSAHGSSDYGVNRSTLDGKFAEYSTGNCAHCHETHASIQGSEPAPVGGPASHALFANSFNTDRTQNLYLETDNFCFYCHSDTSGQQVRNQEYSTTFGGGSDGEGPQSIMAAFNQASYHNLYDIWNFLSNDLTYGAWFAIRGNPCSGCHNSHLAKRNWDNGQPGFPLLSAISRPGVSNNLWGEIELMSGYLSYEAPYAFTNSLEPAGVGVQDGSNTPDYVGFCTSCHNPASIIWSTTLNRQLNVINWGDIGPNQNKHGYLSRDGSSSFREPYLAAGATKNNFILSCLDCHEPHGSVNTMLLRRRVNGEDLEGVVDSTDTMSYACKRCHQDDLTAGAGTGEADRWEYIHHLAADAPYSQMGCGMCHPVAGGGGGMGGGMGGEPIACSLCHGHGMNDSAAPTQATGRITF